MTEPKWSDETVGLIAMKICGAGVVTSADACARLALDALADAGLILPLGGEVREEWASHGGRLSWGGGEAQARRESSEGKGPLMRRTVYIGPWEPVPCQHGARWAPAPVDGVRTWHCQACPETWMEPVS